MSLSLFALFCAEGRTDAEAGLMPSSTREPQLALGELPRGLSAAGGLTEPRMGLDTCLCRPEHLLLIEKSFCDYENACVLFKVHGNEVSSEALGT